MKISLASPVFNEDIKVQEFIHRAVNSLLQISEDIEIVLVNDCSDDETSLRIQELQLRYPFIKLINLTKNSGQHIATHIALNNATGDLVFMMDSDLQVDPEYMIEFYQKSLQINEWDVISASRSTRSSSLVRRIGSNAVSGLLNKLYGKNLKDVGSTFKLIKRKTLDRLLSHDILCQNLPILMLSLNLKIVEILIKYNHAQERKSHYSFPDLVSALVLALLNFGTGSTTLLFLISFGFFLLFLGILLFCGLVIYGAVNQTALPTNLLIFSLVLFILGMQMLMMGAIVFKIERVNKNLDFRKSISQRINYDH